MSWCRAHSGTCGQILLPIGRLLSESCGLVSVREKGKPEGRRQLGRPRRRWLDNIRMDLEEVGWGDVDWIGLAQD
jgi:hypothetical protein